MSAHKASKVNPFGIKGVKQEERKRMLSNHSTNVLEEWQPLALKKEYSDIFKRKDLIFKGGDTPTHLKHVKTEEFQEPRQELQVTMFDNSE